MNYLTLWLDSDGWIQDLCPVSKNETFYGNYCQICGIDIIKNVLKLKQVMVGF